MKSRKPNPLRMALSYAYIQAAFALVYMLIEALTGRPLWLPW